MISSLILPAAKNKITRRDTTTRQQTMTKKVAIPFPKTISIKNTKSTTTRRARTRAKTKATTTRPKKTSTDERAAQKRKEEKH